MRSYTPSFFSDARWPYTVAEQIAKKSLIPGMENVVIPTPNIRSTSTPGFTPSSASNRPYITGAGRVEIVAAADVATKGVVGQMICVQGVITKSLLPGLAVQDRFYVQLKPDLLCEFMVAPFFIRSGRSLGNIGYSSSTSSSSSTSTSTSTSTSSSYYRSSSKLRFLDGAIFVYGPRSTSYSDRITVVKIGEILKAGEMVTIYGRLEGNGSVGIVKGLMIRDCSLVMPNLHPFEQ